MTRSFVLVAVIACAGCAISDQDDIAGIGAPCNVADGQCDVEHVCVAAAGAAKGLCAPVASYGACDAQTPVKHIPGDVAKDKDVDEIDIKTAADAALVQGVRTVTGKVTTFNQGAGDVDLPDFCAFRDLQEVGNGFGVGDTNEATSLDGLQSLTAVHAGLAIFDNSALASLDGLANLRAITPRVIGGRDLDVVIAGNPRLSDADVDAFLTALEAKVGRPLQKIACNNQGRVCGAAETTLVAGLIAGGFR